MKEPSPDWYAKISFKCRNGHVRVQRKMMIGVQTESEALDVLSNQPIVCDVCDAAPAVGEQVSVLENAPMPDAPTERDSSQNSSSRSGGT